MRTAVALMTILIVMPIWFYLVYKILQAVNASELMWFLYWIYVPANVLSHSIASLVTREQR